MVSFQIPGATNMIRTALDKQPLESIKTIILDNIRKDNTLDNIRTAIKLRFIALERLAG